VTPFAPTPCTPPLLKKVSPDRRGERVKIRVRLPSASEARSCKVEKGRTPHPTKHPHTTTHAVRRRPVVSRVRDRYRALGAQESVQVRRPRPSRIWKGTKTRSRFCPPISENGSEESWRRRGHVRARAANMVRIRWQPRRNLLFSRRSSAPLAFRSHAPLGGGETDADATPQVGRVPNSETGSKVTNTSSLPVNAPTPAGKG